MWSESTVELSNEETSRILYETPISFKAEINYVLLTASLRALARITNRTDISLLFENHLRTNDINSIRTERTIGRFTNNVPMIISDINREMSKDVTMIKESIEEIPNQGIGYSILKTREKVLNINNQVNMSFQSITELNAKGLKTFIGSNKATFNSGQTIFVRPYLINGKMSIHLSTYSSITDVEQLSNEIKKEVAHILSESKKENGIVSEPLSVLDSISASLLDQSINNQQGIAEKYSPLSLQKDFINGESFIQEIFTIKNNYSLKDINSAVAKAIQQNGALRSSYGYDKNELFIFEQNLSDDYEVPYLDLSLYSNTVQKEVIVCLSNFDFWKNSFGENSWLSRFLIIQMSSNEYKVLIMVNHMVWDKMSSIILESEIYAILDKKEQVTKLPFSSYVKVAQKMNDFEQNHLEMYKNVLNRYEQSVKDNNIIGLKTSIIEKPNKVDGFADTKDLLKFLMYLLELSMKVNGLFENVECVPGMIVQETRNRMDLDFSKSMGLFIDFVPVLTYDEQKIQEDFTVSESQQLRLLTHSKNIHWLDQFDEFKKAIEKTIVINYIGVYELEYDLLTTMLNPQEHSLSKEITVAVYKDKLILRYPVFESAVHDIHEYYQEMIAKY